MSGKIGLTVAFSGETMDSAVCDVKELLWGSQFAQCCSHSIYNPQNIATR